MTCDSMLLLCLAMMLPAVSMLLLGVFLAGALSTVVGAVIMVPSWSSACSPLLVASSYQYLLRWSLLPCSTPVSRTDMLDAEPSTSAAQCITSWPQSVQWSDQYMYSHGNTSACSGRVIHQGHF